MPDQSKRKINVTNNTRSIHFRRRVSVNVRCVFVGSDSKKNRKSIDSSGTSVHARCIRVPHRQLVSSRVGIARIIFARGRAGCPACGYNTRNGHGKVRPVVGRIVYESTSVCTYELLLPVSVQTSRRSMIAIANVLSGRVDKVEGTHKRAQHGIFIFIFNKTTRSP